MTFFTQHGCLNYQSWKQLDFRVKDDCDTLPLCRALKQSDLRIKSDKKIKQVFFFFNFRGTFSEEKRP